MKKKKMFTLLEYFFFFLHMHVCATGLQSCLCGKVNACLLMENVANFRVKPLDISRISSTKLSEGNQENCHEELGAVLIQRRDVC